MLVETQLFKADWYALEALAIFQQSRQLTISPFKWQCLNPQHIVDVRLQLAQDSAQA
jgi:hypothetical protein